MRKVTNGALAGALFAGTLMLVPAPAMATMDEFCNKHPGDSACLYRDRGAREGRVIVRERVYTQPRVYRTYPRYEYGYYGHDPYYYRYDPYYRPYYGTGAGFLFGLAAGAAISEAWD